jgi:hypothetical protein
MTAETQDLPPPQTAYAEDRAAIMQLESEYLLALDWEDAESYSHPKES